MAKREYTPEELEKELQGVDTKSTKEEDPDLDVKALLSDDDIDELPEGSSLKEVPTISTETLPPTRKRRRYDEDDEEDEVEAELSRLSRDNRNSRGIGTLSASESSLIGYDDGDISDDEAEDLIGDDDYYIDGDDDL